MGAPLSSSSTVGMGLFSSCLVCKREIELEEDETELEIETE